MFDGLWENLNKWATAIYLWASQDIRNWWNGLTHRWDVFRDGLAPRYDVQVQRLKAKREREGTPIYPELQEELVEITEDYPWLRGIILIYVAFQLWAARTTVWFNGLRARTARTVNADLRPTLISHNELLRYLMIYPDQLEEVQPLLDQLGISDDQQRIAFDGMRNTPAIQEILTLLNRDEISEDTATEMLKQLGFSEGDSDLILKLRYFYPSPTDIVSLTGREAFEEDSIKRFSLDADFDRIPEEVYTKAGLTKETARWYWIAHWQNPGIQQVFRMLHRLRPGTGDVTFTEEDMDVYFNLADIAPAFRERLKAISYLPLSRVDTRRMYETGVLTADEVRQSYMDQGYDLTNAQRLTEFTVRLVDYADRDLSRTQVEKLYELGEVDYTEFLDALEAIGYDKAEANYIAAIKVADIEEDRLRSFIDRAEWEYKRNLIGREEVQRVLGAEGIKSDPIDDYIEKWDNENVVEQTIPTKADILKWFGAGIVTREEAVTLLRQRHYSDENINRYLYEPPTTSTVNGYEDQFSGLPTSPMLGAE